MDIYVVQPGDDIESIANKYGISVERLISDNGLINPYALALGQTIVILYPKETYTVKQGDTLTTIADSNGISIMQLFRNNPFLYNREFINPDESLVISYNTVREIQTNGYTNLLLSQDVLSRALPNLTYISIYNYKIDDNSSIINYGDDTDIIKMAKQYDTIPLLMFSALSPIGEVNVEYVYKLLLDIEQQDKLIDEMLQILRSKEYMGINFLISYITEYNQSLYINLFKKISEILRNEGYIFIITITTDYSIYENLDYNSISLLVDWIIFLQNIWIIKNQPPAPISNISLIRPFIEHVTSIVSAKYISLGKPQLGYDWETPFKPNQTAYFMSYNSTLTLAYDQRAVIQFDEVSQTPYFEYNRSTVGALENHIVWFIDARSIKALNDVIIDYDLVGTGLWNLSNYNQQVFSIINGAFDIIKIPIQ